MNDAVSVALFVSLVGHWLGQKPGGTHRIGLKVLLQRGTIHSEVDYPRDSLVPRPLLQSGDETTPKITFFGGPFIYFVTGPQNMFVKNQILYMHNPSLP